MIFDVERLGDNIVLLGCKELLTAQFSPWKDNAEQTELIYVLIA